MGSKKTLRKSTLRVESLEDRMLLAVWAGDVGAAASDTAAEIAPQETTANIVITDLNVATFRNAVARVGNGGTITFDSSLAGQYIDIAGDGKGEIMIRNNMTIEGNGIVFTNTTGNGRSRILNISSSVTNFSISNVSFDGANAEDYKYSEDWSIDGGAAIYFYDVSVPEGQTSSIRANITIQNCNFDSCTATYGGAVFVSGANATVSDCVFNSNSVDYRGGAAQFSDCNLTMNNCSFLNNKSDEYGGALFLSNGGSMEINDSIFQFNSVEAACREQGYGGAICADKVKEASQITMNNCEISFNVVTGSGPDHLGVQGIGCEKAKGGGIALFDTHFIANNCTISNNECTNSLECLGGGLYVSGDIGWESRGSRGNACRLYMTSVRENSVGMSEDIWNPRGEDYSAHGLYYTGGGIYARGILITMSSEIVGNKIVGNTATGALQGSAIYTVDEDSWTWSNLAFTTIAGNYAEAPGAEYGLNQTAAGVWDWGKTTFIGCAVLGNYYKDINSGAKTDCDIYSFAYTANGSALDVLKSCAYNSAAIGSETGFNMQTGNINVSNYAAYFNNYASGDYSIAANSVGVDAASVMPPTDYEQPVAFDIRGIGYDRIVNGIADIGAYELQVAKPSFDVTVTGWSGNYDGNAHAVAVSGLNIGDMVYYSADGTSWGTLNPAYTEVGTYTTYVTVTRSGYQDWTGSAVIEIKQAGGEQLATPSITNSSRANYISYGANRHQLQWSAVANASGYEVSYSEDGTTWKTVTAAGTSAVIKNLTYGADVQYKVKALGTGSYTDSNWSSVKTFNVCPMDINGDGDIAGMDRTLLVNGWMSEEGDEEYHEYLDIDGDGEISGKDRSFLAANWQMEAGDEDLTYPRAVRADAVFAEFATDLSVDLGAF